MSATQFSGPSPNYTMTTTYPDGTTATTTQTTQVPAKNSKAKIIGKSIQQKSNAGYEKMKGMAGSMKAKLDAKRGTKSAPPTSSDSFTTTTYDSSIPSTTTTSYESTITSSTPIAPIAPATTTTTTTQNMQKVESWNEPAPAQAIGSANY